MSQAILQTKLYVPRVQASFISRPRLLAMLDANLGPGKAFTRKMSLISAPAGFGKSTLVADWIGSDRLAPLGKAWLSLEEADDAPVRFWRYGIAALQTARPDIGQALARALSAQQLPPIQILLTDLLNEVASLEEPLLLILDDYHLITHAQIQEDLTFLVQHVPPNFHLVVITRADPSLPLARLRARGQLTEVRQEDLRFDAGEAAALLAEAMAPALSPEEVTTLNRVTEGWAVGLQMAAHALQGAYDPGRAPGARGGAAEQALRNQSTFIERLAHSNRYILEYLAEEVLAQQPRAVRRFLLRTAILDRLCGSLCNAITGQEGGQESLERLAQQNLFVVPLDEQRNWYRYHHLFAKLLQGRLRQEAPESIPRLHWRAAVWFEEHGYVEAAIVHALSAEDYSRAARLLDEHATGIIMQGRARIIEEWLRRLPVEHKAALPRANLAFAWALLLRGRYGEIEPYLRRADEAIEPGQGPLRGELDALRAALADTRGDAEEAMRHAERAITSVPQDNLFVQALAHFSLAGARRVSGDVDAAIVTYEQALPLCRAAGLPVPEMLARAHLGFLYLLRGQLQRAADATRPALSSRVHHPAAGAAASSLGMVLLEWDRLQEAETYLQQAMALGRESGHNAALVLAQISLCRLHRARGQARQAQMALEEAATLLQSGAPAWIGALLTAEQVHLRISQGDLATARQLLSQETGEASAGPVREVIPLALARLLSAQETGESLARARELLDDVLRTAEAGGRQGRVVEALLLRALVHEARGQGSAAEEALQRAMALAEVEGYVRLFVEAGAPAAAILKRIGSPYAWRLLRSFPAAVRREVDEPSALAEPLTERELQVLQGMARGLTYQEIADELVVSINTVRHHVKSLYGKLQVDKRTLALEKARALDLL